MPAVREPPQAPVGLEQVQIGEGVRRRRAGEHDQPRVGFRLAAAPREQRSRDRSERQDTPSQPAPTGPLAQSTGSVALAKSHCRVAEIFIVETLCHAYSRSEVSILLNGRNGMLQTRVVRRVALGLAIAALGVAIAIPAFAATNPGSAKKGKAIFVANCVTCHVLKAANGRGTIGPNLDQKKPAYKLIVARVTNGKSPMICLQGHPDQDADPGRRGVRLQRDARSPGQQVAPPSTPEHRPGQARCSVRAARAALTASPGVIAGPATLARRGRRARQTRGVRAHLTRFRRIPAPAQAGHRSGRSSTAAPSRSRSPSASASCAPR